MDSAMAIAASGMAAASASFAASASHTVAATLGTLPGGGATTAISNPLPSFSLAYDPSAPFANLQGMIAAQSVDPVVATVNQISESEAIRANLAVFETASKNFKSLLDTLA
ncbi:MAG TPA: hypothetical protein VMO78_16415 [Rhizomicrobium sp.]|nr:hypothetical protein [Rhizomicrobium sp.]